MVTFKNRIIKNIEVKKMIEDHCPHNEIVFFQKYIKSLSNEQKKMLIYLLVNSNKDDRVLLSKINSEIACLLEKNVISARETKNSTYSIAVLPAFPYLKTQLKQYMNKHFYKLKKARLL